MCFVRVSRCYFRLDSSPVQVQLHAFSDASSQAFAAVIYARSVYSDGHVETRLLASKSRVSPIKRQTIPRLELLGAVILARLVNTVVNSLPDKLPIFYWVDSMTVLCWIRNEKPWKQYVSHRVDEIRQLTNKESWRFCPGLNNPADLPTRGISAAELSNKQLWWCGPQFLRLPECGWPESPLTPNITEAAAADIVKNPPRVFHSLVTTESDPSRPMVKLDEIIDCEQISSLTRLLRITAYVLRFVTKLMTRTRGDNLVKELFSRELAAREIDQAENLWIRTVQASSFAKEIDFLKSNSDSSAPIYVKQFGLFIDDDNIMRCKGRINNASLSESSKNPVLLPSRHPFTDLVISDTHGKVKHSGVNYTLSTSRERFWILRGRQAVKRVLKSCVICRKLEGPAYRPVASPDLPNDRVSEDPPFTHTGIDFAGPLYIHTEGNSTRKEDNGKVYVCLFTCASTRAIHLELTKGLSVESFLLAFRRFTSRRGLPATLLSDNAKTFKSSAKEIRQIARSTEVHRYLTNNRTTWNFIVERAPWWGGFWERMVKSVKMSLRKTIGRSTLTYDELNTVLIEVEATINARPITYVYDDQESISYPLTPSHLISGRRVTVMPNSEHFEVVSTNNSLTKRARHQKKLLEQITKRWRCEYLLSLRENAAVNSKANNKASISVGDIVVVKNDSTKRNFWKLAKVEELLFGRDGKVRSANVRVSSSNRRPLILRRVIQQLIPIEVNSSEHDVIL